MDNKLNVTVTLDRIVVKQMTADEITKGGIIIPENARKKPNYGWVIAQGPGFPDLAMSTEVGSFIMFEKGPGVEFQMGGEDYLLIRQPNVYMVLHEEKKIINE